MSESLIVWQTVWLAIQLICVKYFQSSSGAALAAEAVGQGHYIHDALIYFIELSGIFLPDFIVL